ncbi:MAG: hypothetical protein FJ263_00955 [Planctomycetes bacterium]|nr:hypothetical protein [Planctomycetota bacterium]
MELFSKKLFSRDADLVKFEPGLFAEVIFGGQVLGKGTNGVVSGTSFSAAGGDFINKGATAGGVIFLQSLDGTINATYEIVSVDSATQLTISVVRSDAEQAPIAVGTASGLIYRIVTFAPQAAEALVEIAGWFGLRPGMAETTYGVEDICDATPLHLLSAYRVLAMVFGTLGGTEDEKKTYAQKRDYYMGLYKEARGQARITLDVEHDGAAEKVILGGSVRLVRE